MICFWKDDDDDWEVERVESYWTQSWRLTPLMDQDQDRVDRLGRKEREASHETLSTTVTSADEFVWIDSHNRCVVCRTIIIEIIDKHLLLQTCGGSTPALVH